MPRFNFFRSAVRNVTSVDPHRILFEDDSGGRLTFGRLEALLAEFQLEQSLPIVVYLPHGCLKATVAAVLLCKGIPALMVSSTMPPAELRKLCLRFPFGGVLTTPGFAEGPRVAFPLGLEFFPMEPVGALRESRPAWLLMTSGSTGSAKIVAMSEENLISRTTGEIELLQIQSASRLLNCLTFTHDLGLNQLLTALVSGSTLRIVQQALPGDIFSILCTESVTGFTGTPLNWSSILRLSQNSAPIESFSGHLTISGGALHEKQLCALAKLFPRARLIKTYGQTETFRTLAEARQNKISANSLGRPIANVRALLLDEDLRPCAQGEVGQLVHLGDGRMNGYYCDLEASRQKEFVLGVEAGILTGDFFRQNEEGDFEFVGRRDDMIKRRGHRIYTSEIRNLLCELADVADAHVIDVSKGEVERLIAWLTPTPQSVLTPEIMEARCRATMAAHKVPDEFRIAENFPSTVSHKINSQKLVDEVRNSDDRR